MRRLGDPNRDREKRRQLRLMLVLERQYTFRFAREIFAETKRIIDFFDQTYELPPVSDGHIQRLMAIESDMAQRAFRAFGERITDQGKSSGIVLEAKFDFAAFFMRAGLAYVADEATRMRITNIGETTRGQIVAQVERGFADGQTIREISQSILRAAPGIAKYRGEMIARTETHGAANAGADYGARETGLILRKEWMSVNDKRTRDIHRDIDGDKVGMDEKFDVGGELLRWPGDPKGSGWNIINCRCVTGHIVVD